MNDLAGNLAIWFALLMFTFVALLSFGADFAPEWAKSRGFLIVASMLIVVGSNSLA